ncbi:hypothetical protein NHX12_019069, partial [Muraenolepis orangiensis]
ELKASSWTALNSLKMKAVDEPAYLTVGTDVSAKYRGAFCEAKIKTVKRLVKVKVALKGESTSQVVQDDQVKGPLRVGSTVEVRTNEGPSTQAVISKLTDASLYTVVFDDGDEKTLRRTSLCLKGERHFAESEDDILGKVCCVQDEGDRSGWFLALVVSPSCSDEVMVKKDQCLIRSFSDSKLSTVARKDVHVVASDTISRPEFSCRKGHKAAVAFLRTQEPEEEVDPEERDHFLQQLYKFMEDRGTPINKPPVLGYKDLNLFKLFRLVYQLGGCHKIESGSVWKQVYVDLGIPVLNSAASYNVKTAYRKYLYGFEEYCRSASITFRTIHHNKPRPPVSTLASPMSAEAEPNDSGPIKIQAAVEKVEDESDGERGGPRRSHPSTRGRGRWPGKSRRDCMSRMERERQKEEQQGGETSGEEQREGEQEPPRRRSHRRHDDSDKESEEEDDDDEEEEEDEEEDDDEDDEGEQRRDRGEGQEGDEDEDCLMGTKVRVKYGRGKSQKIYEANIKKMDSDHGDLLYLVHYYGWNVRYDEWVKADRIIWPVDKGGTKKRPRKKLKNKEEGEEEKGPRLGSGRRGRPQTRTPPSTSSVRSFSKTPSSDGQSRHNESSPSAANGDDTPRRRNTMSGLYDSDRPSCDDSGNSSEDSGSEDAPPPEVVAPKEEVEEEEKDGLNAETALKEESELKEDTALSGAGPKQEAGLSGLDAPPSADNTSSAWSAAQSPLRGGVLKRQDEPMVVLHCLPTQRLPPEPFPSMDSDTDSAPEDQDLSPEDGPAPWGGNMVNMAKRKALEQPGADKKFRLDQTSQDCPRRTPPRPAHIVAQTPPRPAHILAQTPPRPAHILSQTPPRPAHILTQTPPRPAHILAQTPPRPAHLLAPTPPRPAHLLAPTPPRPAHLLTPTPPRPAHFLAQTPPRPAQVPSQVAVVLPSDVRTKGEELASSPPAGRGPLLHPARRQGPTEQPLRPQAQQSPTLQLYTPTNRQSPSTQLHQQAQQSALSEEMGPQMDPEALVCHEVDLDDLDEKEKDQPNLSFFEVKDRGQKRLMDGTSSPSAKKAKRSQKHTNPANKMDRNGTGFSLAAQSSDSEDNSVPDQASVLDRTKPCTPVKQAISRGGKIPRSPQLPSPNRTYKWSFQLDELDRMSSSERVSFLQDKLQEIRKYYLSLKSEVASIDRRRKRLKKKEREVSNTTVSTSSGSEGMSPTQSSVAVECR